MSMLALPQEPAACVSYELSPAQGAEAQALTRSARVLWAHRFALPIPPPFDCLERSVAAELANRWKEPCEGAFEYLAVKYPDSLLRLIQSGALADGDLTFAAEIAGRLDNKSAVRRILLPLLSHHAAVVREGAVYGLAGHAEDHAVRTNLARLAAEDPSVAVRSAAAEALDES